MGPKWSCKDPLWVYSGDHMKRTLKLTVSEGEAQTITARAKSQGLPVASYLRHLVWQDIPELAVPVAGTKNSTADGA